MSSEDLRAAYADLAAAMEKINTAHRAGSPGAVIVLLDDGGDDFAVLAKGTTGGLATRVRDTCLNRRNMHQLLAESVMGALRQRKVMRDEN